MPFAHSWGAFTLLPHSGSFHGTPHTYPTPWMEPTPLLRIFPSFRGQVPARVIFTRWGGPDDDEEVPGQAQRRAQTASADTHASRTPCGQRLPRPVTTRAGATTKRHSDLCVSGRGRRGRPLGRPGRGEARAGAARDSGPRARRAHDSLGRGYGDGKAVWRQQEVTTGTWEVGPHVSGERAVWGCLPLLTFRGASLPPTRAGRCPAHVQQVWGGRPRRPAGSALRPHVPPERMPQPDQDPNGRGRNPGRRVRAAPRRQRAPPGRDGGLRT